MPDGFSLNIDPKFMQDLEKVEQKIKDIATASEKTRDIVIDSFTKMRTQGLDPFVQAAKTFQQEMRGMRVVNLGLGVVTREASAATDKINLLVDALNKLLVANGKVNASNSKDSNVSKVNQLYKERLQIEERLHKMMLKGAQGKTVSPYESQNISRLAQRAQVIEQEIKQLQNSSKVSSQVILAIMKNEEQYTQAVQRFANERQVARNAEAEQQRKEAEAEKIRLAQLAKQRAEMYKKQNYAQNTTSQGALKFSDTAQTYNREKQAIEYLTIARNNLSKSDKDYANTLELLNKAIRKHEENLKNATRTQEELTAAQNKRNKASSGTTNQADKQYAQNIRDYNNAMKASEATINQRTNKLARLRQVEAQMAQDEARYAQQLSRVRAEMDRLSQANDNASKKTKELQKNQRNLMDTAGQLQRKLALLFSVSAIQGYVSKLVEVRGEFEMQQRSLQVLLQNKDEANALWDKTVSLAVKSPFRIKDLVTYTKQLAAYRVESDKLFETNKMLADVSAGLGVDMNRLILAFGQVKAANYLRGTELRQFSEAGVNMLGELAKYFTELEGRAISVGDVFERVSKRMVTFQDVNEIFKRITSEGGIFFKMQEKQSETLKGMIMNFRDSMDLMLNDIGKDQDSMLKNSIRLAKEFVDNWRQFEPLIKTIGTSFLAAFGVKSLMAIAKGLANLWAIVSAHPFIAIAGAVALVVTYIYQAAQAQTKLNAAMQEVEKENLASLEESIGLYKQLTQTINDTTKSYEERDKAMSQLKSKFNDILPDQYTELKYVEKLGENYRDAEQAMLDYYNAKAREQKKARVEQEFSGELEGTDIQELIKSTRGYIDSLYDANKITQDVQVKLNSGVSRVINSIVDDMKSGKLGVSIDNFHKEFSARISKFSGIDWESLGGGNFLNSLFRQEDVQDIISTLGRYQDALESIEGLAYETYDQQEAAKMINQEKNNLNTAVNAFKKAASLYQKYVDAIPDATGTVEEKRKKIEEDVKKILTDLPKEMVAYGEYLNVAFSKLKTEADKGAFAFASAIQTIESELYASRDSNGVLDGLAGVALNNVVLNEAANDAAKQMVDNFKEGLENQAATLAMNDFQKAAIEGAEIIAEKFKVSTNDFAKFVPKYGESLSNVRQRVKSEIENMEALLQAYNLSITTGASMLSEKVLSTTKEQASHMTSILPALKEYLKYLGEEEKGGKNKRDKMIDERIKVIDQMNKKYKELNKTLSRTEALQGAFDAYKDAFADAYGRNDVRQMSAEEFASKVLNFPNENEIVKWLDNLAKTAKNKEDKIKVELAKGEYVFDMKVRVKEESDKALIDQIEDMFSGYEMSIELQKLNIPKDLAKQLFNVDSVDLSSIRNKISSELAKAQATGGQEDRVKELKKQLDKVEELEDKAMQERLKKYVKYMLQAQSERVKIKIDEMNQLSEIEKLNVSELDKNIMRQGVREETQKKLDKAAWEDFKNSDMYIRIFEDLDRASSKALSAMQDKLVELRGSLSELSPENLKEIVRLEEKIAEAKIDKNPFAGLITSIKNLSSARKALNKLEEEHGFTYEEGMKTYEEQKNKIDELQISIKKLTDAYGADTPNAVFEKEDLETLKKANKALAEILKKMGLLNSQATNSKIGIEDSFSGMSNIFSQAAQSTNEIADALDKIGALSDAQKDNFDTISGIFGGMSGIMSGAAKMASGNPFAIVAGGIEALGGIASIVGEIFAIGDKKKERQIQREIKLVEDLEREYEKLEKAIDNAYSINTLQASGKTAKDNIEAQKDSYEKMIAAEDDKKKKDEDRINEWKLAIEDLDEQKAELDKQLVSTATGGIMDDVLSAAQEFTNAWLDAFKETGDGLSGLESNFKETMLEMVKQQASMLISNSYIEKWKKQLEQYINPDDLELSTDEAKKWVNAVTTSLPQLNQALENYFTAMQQAGVDISGSGELSGLQRGIQSVSESTAQIIEAYLNSVRFYVADSNSKLTMIANQIIGGDETANPMLSELKTQTEMIRAIRDMFSSVIRNGHPTFGGAFIKVAL